nr:transposase [Rhizobium wuzhouense]
MPEIDLTTAMAVEAFAPTTVNFRSRRDFATWPGLVPKRNSSGEKPVLA